VTREQFLAEQERRKHQLRGCLDPNCAFCNPETAGSGASDPNMAKPGSPFTISSFDPGRDFTIVWDPRTGIMIDPAAGVSSAATPPTPPASYRAARGNIERWIVQAPQQAFDDIVGNSEALEQLRDAIRAPVTHKELYEAYGMKMPKGALLSGPPGCGKTMFARAAASEMKALYGAATEFVSISGSELQSMFVGETEARIKAIFTFAREYKAFHGHPLLVFMDEADVLLPDRSGRVRRLASWEESQVATFLAEMDGIQESGAFVLLASNRPGVIDQAVLRDGRCDFKITVKRPNAEAVEAILRKNFAGIFTVDATEDELVFAAVEGLFDPHKILAAAETIVFDVKANEVKEHSHKHFLLENIVSGAMAASVLGRAKRRAFARDKVDGVARGVQVDDVLKAVNDIFEENKTLDHGFAMEEFRREVMAELMEKVRAASGGGQANDDSPRRAA
jgi:SpoVK/Ycf46/Vps4 family AAA+-type ATPase